MKNNKTLVASIILGAAAYLLLTKRDRDALLHGEILYNQHHE